MVMASGLITSWQIDGEIMETVTDFIFLASKITADSYCSCEIKRPFDLCPAGSLRVEGQMPASVPRVFHAWRESPPHPHDIGIILFIEPGAKAQTG